VLSLRSMDSASLDIGRVNRACLAHDDAARLDKGDGFGVAGAPHRRRVRGKTLRP